MRACVCKAEELCILKEIRGPRKTLIPQFSRSVIFFSDYVIIFGQHEVQFHYHTTTINVRSNTAVWHLLVLHMIW